MADRQQRIADLEAELARLQAQVTAETRTETVASGKGAVAIGQDAQGNFIVTGDGTRVLLTEADPETLWKAYLADLADQCRRLPLGIIDTEFAQHGRPQVQLSDVYVDLDAVSHARSATEDASGWGLRLLRGEAGGRASLHELLAPANEGKLCRHALLGDPGSGKTTFVQHLCRGLAAGEPVFSGAESLLPLRFIARDVAARSSSSGNGEAGFLWADLRRQLARVLDEAAARRLQLWVQERALTHGAFVVVDGLDEVPEADGRRRALLDAIESLAATLAETPSRFLVTARPYAYAEARWQLDGFDVLVLSPFSKDQVDRFIDLWYLSAARAAFTWDDATARAKARQLRRALSARPYLGDLASRPLLLTLMASLHSSWGQLPEDRAELYEQTVRLLLGRWQRHREIEDDNEEPARVPSGGSKGGKDSLSRLLRVDEERLRSALETLAMKVHQRQAERPEDGDAPAEISEGEILVAFKPLLGEVSPEDLIGYLEHRAGLLIDRGGGVYAFPHRSFQEYLAASYVSGQPEPSERFRDLAFEDPKWWREVVLLGIGRVGRGGLGNAVDLVTKLLPADPTADVDDTQLAVAVICGQALRELRITTKIEEKPHYGVILERAREWLVKIVEEGRMEPKERLEAGDVLGYLGDPRPGVATQVVDGGVQLPDIDWVEISAGTFWMGSTDDDPDSQGHEKPQHEVDLDRFWISRYPVTNAQFRPFVEDGGYTNREWWTDAGWDWLQGAEAELYDLPEGDFREDYRNWLAGRPQEKRREPFFWDDEALGAPSRPVVGMTWFEAVAFCRWLAARFADPVARASFDGVVDPSRDLCVQLPNEAQWEKAARGDDRRIWPWGSDFDPSLCNSSKGGLGEPSIVGIYPTNRSPAGIVDLAGNVWEWTTTVWSSTSFYNPDFGYPFVFSDTRNEENVKALRVIRGGSFYEEKSYVRCSSRRRSDPAFFDYGIGFRVVLSLADSES